MGHREPQQGGEAGKRVRQGYFFFCLPTTELSLTIFFAEVTLKATLGPYLLVSPHLVTSPFGTRKRGRKEGKKGEKEGREERMEGGRKEGSRQTKFIPLWVYCVVSNFFL